MPIQHILYIPATFLLGFLFGMMSNERRQGKVASNSISSIDQNEKLNSKTSVGKLLKIFLLFLLVFVITHMFEIPGGLKEVSQHLGGLEIFDKSPVFSGYEVYKRIARFPVEGIIAYKRFTYTTDIIFPISLFAFLLTFARFISQRVLISGFLVYALPGLPFFWLAFDLIENAVVFNLLSKFPNQNDLLANSLGYITALKFALLFFSIVTPSLLFIFAKKLLEPIRK